jgi:predicted amidohydrolase YtcJ
VADLTVLNKSPLTVPPETIHEIQVLMTIVGGKVVYKKGSVD